MRRAVWPALIALVIFGVLAVAARAMFIANLATLAHPLERPMLVALGRPAAMMEADRRAATDFDVPYAAHPMMTLMHIIPGGIFIAFAPLQFSSKLRRRHVRAHRIVGRFLLIAAFASACAALFFGLLMPFGGNAERVVISLFGGWLMVSVVCGYFAIRERDQARHRRWMIRAFSVALAVSFIRVISIVIGAALAWTTMTTQQSFVASLWIGWIVAVAFAEWWIRYTSPLHAADHDARDVVLLQS